MGEQLTEMEQLCRDLMGCVCEYYPAAQLWCDEHSVETIRYVCRENAEDARDDVERRIAEARFHDGDLAKAYGEAVGYLEGIRARLRAEGEHIQDAAEDRMEKADALEELREAGRIMPEGLSWPKYEDGEPLRIGGDVVVVDEERKVTAIEFDGERVRVKSNNLSQVRDQGDPFKRPDPKATALDRDGVPVVEGDTVWDDFGVMRQVAGLELMGDGSVLVKFAGCHPCDCSPSAPASILTHKRPDSWEQLEFDAGECPWRYCIKRGIPYSDDGFEEMAGDMVARAKALAAEVPRG